MDPLKKPARPADEALRDEAPQLEQQDWEELEGAAPFTDRVPADANGRPLPELPPSEPDGELPGEEADNPYQRSDEALPDDEAEAVIRRNPSREGGRFDEV
jgi:hypothetical protein